MNRLTSPSAVISILLIAAGTLFFLDNIHVIRIYEVWRFWPLALVAAGIARLYERRDVAGWTWGLFLILCGALWLSSNLHLLHVNAGSIWPLGLITLGVMGLTRTLETRLAFQSTVVSAACIREIAIFSGSKKKLNTSAFEGGEVACLFGGVELNLRKCSISNQANQAVIDVSIAFGGVEIKIPEGWRVANHCVAVFGACEDKTLAPRPENASLAPVLIITGHAMFGAVTVEN
jgi:hypothetical protein